MANRTVKDARCLKGTNPQYLIEKIIRTRIYDSRYWKEDCFALTAELIVDKVLDVRYVGGIYGGNIKPTPFLCLVLKMLQIQPEKDIIIEFIKNDDFKYMRALGALYLRLTGASLDCYKYLEPLFNDYRKLRYMNRQGNFELLYMDEFIDKLLREDRFCDIILPRVQKRSILEETEKLEPRISALNIEADGLQSETEEDIEINKRKRSISPQTLKLKRRNKEKKRSRSPKHKRDSRSRSRNKEITIKRHKSRSRSGSRTKTRHHHHSSSHHHSKSDKGSKNNSDSKSGHHKSGKDTSGTNKMTKEELEIENARRKKLGIQPLRV